MYTFGVLYPMSMLWKHVDACDFSRFIQQFCQDLLNKTSGILLNTFRHSANDWSKGQVWKLEGSFLPGRCACSRLLWGNTFHIPSIPDCGLLHDKQSAQPKKSRKSYGSGPPVWLQGQRLKLLHMCGVCHETYGPSPRLLNTTSCKVSLVPNFNKACQLLFADAPSNQDQNDWNTLKLVCSWSGAWAWEHFWS